MSFERLRFQCAIEEIRKNHYRLPLREMVDADKILSQ